VELPKDARVRVQQGVQRALNNPAVNGAHVEMAIGDVCELDLSAAKCGLGSIVVYAEVVDTDGSSTGVKPAEIEARLVKLLKGVRKEQVAEGKVEPVGVTVNYDVSLTGFRGRKVKVCWSLYDATGGHKVPPRWLSDQCVRWWKGEADSDSASDSFWVPLPAGQGPYFVRVSVWDDDDVRLDFVNTSSFE